MARLTAAQRNALPDSAFAGPNRTYPVPDKSHAIAAERLSGRGVKAGNISRATAKKIDRKASRVAAGGLRSALNDASKGR